MMNESVGRVYYPVIGNDLEYRVEADVWVDSNGRDWDCDILAIDLIQTSGHLTPSVLERKDVAESDWGRYLLGEIDAHIAERMADPEHVAGIWADIEAALTQQDNYDAWLERQQ